MTLKNKHLIGSIFRSLSSKFYEILFHEKISDDVNKFLSNLSYVTIGTIIATFFTFIFNISAGRLLGPSEYGKYTLIISISTFISMVLLLGIPIALVKYNSESVDYTKRKKVLSTTYLLILVWVFFATSICYLFIPKISMLFSIDIEFLHISIILALSSGLYALSISTVRSLHQMKFLSLLRPLYSGIILVIYAIFIMKEFKIFYSMVIPIFFANIIIGVVILHKISNYFKFEFDKTYAKKILKYGTYSFFSGFSFILYTNIDKILINKYMLVEHVGQYNAYYFGSIGIASVLVGIFQTVFFPTISKYEDKSPIMHKINKIVPYIVLFGIPCILFTQIIILKLYGNNYPIEISLVIIFAITSVLFVCYDLYAWFLNSLGTRGARFNLESSLSIAATDIIGNIILIPRLGLLGAIMATLLAYCFGFFVLRFRWSNYNHVK